MDSPWACSKGVLIQVYFSQPSDIIMSFGQSAPATSPAGCPSATVTQRKHVPVPFSEIMTERLGSVRLEVRVGTRGMSRFTPFA